MKVKKFNSEVLESELNKWLQENSNNVNVLDIKYAVGGMNTNCISNEYALVIYENKPNDGF